MSFTYTLGTDLGSLRLKLNDVVSGVGVRPNGTNFSDAELEYLLSDEGSVNLAWAAACEILAAAWSQFAGSQAAGGVSMSSSQAERYATLAASLRMEFDTAKRGAVAIAFARDDGYAQAATT